MPIHIIITFDFAYILFSHTFNRFLSSYLEIKHKKCKHTLPAGALDPGTSVKSRLLLVKVGQTAHN